MLLATDDRDELGSALSIQKCEQFYSAFKIANEKVVVIFSREMCLLTPLHFSFSFLRGVGAKIWRTFCHK